MEIKSRNKKIYSKPELEVVKVDHEISMVMMTGSVPEDPIIPGVTGSAVESSPSFSEPSQVYKTSEESNPFGDSSPNYNN